MKNRSVSEKKSVATTESRSLDAQAAKILRDEIVSGDIPPGSRLLEVELSERLDLSRGTIRSALQQLIHEGLVVQYPFRGCVVVSLSSQDAWELYTLRSALEGLAAKLAAEAMTTDRISTLKTGLQDLKKAAKKKNWRDFAIADFALHQVIIRFSGHRRLQEQYKIIEHQIRLYIAACNSLHPSLDELIEDHARLVQAICAADAPLAESIAKAHNTDGELLVKHLQNLEKQAAMLKF